MALARPTRHRNSSDELPCDSDSVHRNHS